MRAILRRCSVVSNVCLNGGGALVQPLPLACGDIDRGKRGGPHLAEDDDDEEDDGDEWLRSIVPCSALGRGARVDHTHVKVVVDEKPVKRRLF